ncbi:MAG: 2-keto-4-pentenoate hydratase [Caulobacterales bacterium]|nr:2-keto-4-pentenoate hydratase [Caulobacterales bacterium]
MSASTTPAASAAAPGEIAHAFVGARLAARALPGFPGVMPATLAQAYAIQDAALALFPDKIAGWKVGRVWPELQARLGDERVAGPTFLGALRTPAVGETVSLAAISGGFAAVEAEFVYRLAVDAPVDKTDWTAEEALGVVAALHVGVEFAGSPLKTINDLGSTAVASDFGNNAALVVGPEIAGWRDRADAALTAETFIDDVRVGSGTAASVPGGPAPALAFLLGHCAARGLPLKAGMYVTTGAATGIHEISAGQSARVSFGEFGEIHCVAEVARPTAR